MKAAPATDAAVEFIQTLSWDKLPDRALDVVKTAFIDTAGVMLAGVGMAPMHVLRSTLSSCSDDKGSATVVGGTARATAPDAALANGAAAHILDLDDWSLTSYSHPSAVLVPTLLALGEVERSTGKELVEAYTAGYEVMTAVARPFVAKHYAAGFHATATMCTIGAAAAAAKLMRLDRQKTAYALGIASSLAGGLRGNFGTDVKSLHAGQAARNGMMAATLARDGYTAMPDTFDNDLGFAGVFGRESLGEVRESTQALGKRWALLESPPAIKAFASCGCTHSPIAAALQVMLQGGLDARDIDSVEVFGPRLYKEVLIYATPTTGLEGKFSLEYSVAVALLDGAAGIPQFTDEAVARPVARSLAGKVHFTPSETYDRMVADGEDLAARVVVRAGANTIESEVLHPPGTPLNPVTLSTVIAKFRGCATPPLAAAEAQDLLDVLLALPEANSADISRRLQPAAVTAAA